MDNGIILILLFTILIVIGITVRYFLWRSRKKDKENLNRDWQKFLSASSTNHIGDIKRYGDKLIWNKYLKQNQLTKITQVVESKIKKHPELEELKINAYNKQLNYDRISIETKKY